MPRSVRPIMRQLHSARRIRENLKAAEKQPPKPRAQSQAQSRVQSQAQSRPQSQTQSRPQSQTQSRPQFIPQVNLSNVKSVTQDDSKKLEIDIDEVVVKIEEPKTKNTGKTKIAICICGYVPRSFKQTLPSITKNIIDPLEDEYDIDLYCYSLLSKSKTIDSSIKDENTMAVDNNSVYLINTKNTTTKYQEDISDEISQIIKKNNIKLRELNVVNFVRQLYMEQHSFEVIKNSGVDYKAIVYLQPDMFICKQISKSEIEKSIKHKKYIYTCSFNDWNGYGFGYYIGSPEAMNIVTSQIDNLYTLTNVQPEKLLKITIDKNKLERRKSDMFHFKVRANGKPNVYYQLLKKYLSSTDYQWVLKNFNNPNLVFSKYNHKSKKPQKNKRRSCPI